MFKQTKGLPILFLGEFLEKFSFWGLQSLLVLYLTKSMIVVGNKAYAIFGAFTALTFMLSILSGFLADRFLGFRHALILGVIFIILGNVLLSLNGLNPIYGGLTIIAFGTALFTTNNTNLLGTFYDKNDIGRNRGFVILYMATNIGGLLGPVIYGIISVNYGWRYCFLVSAVALGAWFLLLLVFSQQFKNKGLPPQSARQIKTSFFFPYFLMLIIIISIFCLMHFLQYVAILLILVGIVALGFFLLTIIYKQSSDRYIILMLLAMISFCLIFFSIEFQVNSSLLLFVEQHVNRNIFNWVMPANMFASVEPFFVVILAPFFALLWKRFRQRQPSPFVKIAAGLLLEGASFVIFALAAYFAVINSGKVSISWLLMASLLLGAGELCLMPTVISSITQLAPIRLKGTLMGMLYLSLGFSGYLAGVIAALTIRGVPRQGIFLITEYTKIYVNIAQFAFLAAMTSLVLYVFTRYLLNKP